MAASQERNPKDTQHCNQINKGYGTFWTHNIFLRLVFLRCTIKWTCFQQIENSEQADFLTQHKVVVSVRKKCWKLDKRASVPNSS